MKSRVTQVGSMAYAFEEESIMILFGLKAPQELRYISVIHEFERDPKITIKENLLIIDGQKYDIVRIGTEAIKNLVELGHISVLYGSATGSFAWFNLCETIRNSSCGAWFSDRNPMRYHLAC